MEENKLTLYSAEEDALLWKLFALRMADYTRGESTSLRVETAAALLESIRFSLELYRMERGDVPPDLPLEALLAELETCVRRRTERTRLTYLRACRCLYQEENLALEDTLRGIGIFFRAYDPRFFAADTPCDIDYQLTWPVEEKLRGVTYIRTYLDRLLAEDTILRKFHPDKLRRLWVTVCPGHRELLVNLCEPAVTAALGVTVTEGSLYELDITSAGQETLSRLLKARTPGQRRELLADAGKKLSRRLMLGGNSGACVERLALELAPRVEAVLAAGGDWQALFPAFS